MDISAAFNLLLVVGIILAFAGAALRTWGTACLGPEVMRDRALHGEKLVAEGPYRFVRNPLYLGSWLNGLALALLMPPSGAIVALVLVMLFQMRLIFAEEAYLSSAARPAIRGLLRACTAPAACVAPRVAGSGKPTRWGQALLTEIFLWGTAVSFAAVGWQYNAHLLIQCVLVSLGAAFIVRGIAAQQQTQTD